jgi:hypothetical protein
MEIIFFLANFAGSGGPLGHIEAYLRTWRQFRVKVTLSDLYPDSSLVSHNGAQNAIHYWPDPVDATNTPAEFNNAGLFTMHLSLHHMTPAFVRRILSNAVSHKRPIAIMEMQRRSICSLLQVAFGVVPAALLSVLVLPFSLYRLFFTFVVPVIPFILLFDGCVSALRTYEPNEVQNILVTVEGSSDYDWTFEVKNIPLTRVSYIGVPKKFNSKNA